jgi:hypothetical protein
MHWITTCIHPRRWVSSNAGQDSDPAGASATDTGAGETQDAIAPGPQNVNVNSTQKWGKYTENLRYLLVNTDKGTAWSQCASVAPLSRPIAPKVV